MSLHFYHWCSMSLTSQEAFTAPLYNKISFRTHFYYWIAYCSFKLSLALSALCFTQPSFSLLALLHSATLPSGLPSASGSHRYEITINEDAPKPTYQAEKDKTLCDCLEGCTTLKNFSFLLAVGTMSLDCKRLR